MTKRIGVLLGSTALAGLLPFAALAQTSSNLWTPTEGPYIGGYVGGSLPYHISPHGGAADDLPGYFSDNVMGQGTLGYGLGNGLRFEIEGAYRYNELSNVHETSPYTSSVHNGLAMTTGMVNAIYDIDPASFGYDNFGLVPHIGVGVGDAHTYPEHMGYFDGSTIAGSRDDLAYQGIVGVGFQIAPEMKVDLDYHYLGTDIQDHHTDPTADAAIPYGTKTQFSTSSNEVLIGLRYEFEVPEAPPQPAPPPPPAPALASPPPAAAPEAQRQFQVFFDFDKSNITSAAANVIQQAAMTIRQGNIARITVTGHTDTVGSVKYNQALSERRAAAVKRQLVTDGVASDEITTIGVGKSGLLVPTADGVREPQNRRAVIELNGAGM
jgi:outer membrane protein OmpA-like peptidoglycan-associated protein